MAPNDFNEYDVIGAMVVVMLICVVTVTGLLAFAVKTLVQLVRSRRRKS